MENRNEKEDYSYRNAVIDVHFCVWLDGICKRKKLNADDEVLSKLADMAKEEFNAQIKDDSIVEIAAVSIENDSNLLQERKDAHDYYRISITNVQTEQEMTDTPSDECMMKTTHLYVYENKDTDTMVPLASGGYSNGKYDIAISMTVYWNTRGGLGNLELQLTRVEGKTYDAGTNSITCRKFVFDGHVYDGWSYVYRDSYTANYPSSGTTYTKYISRGYYATPAYLSGSMFEATFSDGTTLLDWWYIGF